MKNILVLLIFLFIFIEASAQEQIMRVVNKTGTVSDFLVENIDKICFLKSTELVGSDKIHITQQEAGTLKMFFEEINCETIIKLKITGRIDARDFNYIKNNCTSLSEIDLSEAQIVEYYGNEGTNEGYNYLYVANEIPLGAFFYWLPEDEGMPSLTKVILPEGITAIRRNAFARAYNLTEINIPEGVTEIDFVAFAVDKSLESIKFPSTLKRIGEQAFYDNTSLRTVYIDAKMPPTLEYNDVFGTTHPRTNEMSLHVPEGSGINYFNSNWRNYFTIYEQGHNEPFVPSGKECEAIDLGLSVKWASQNVGATCEADYGLFFSWGEIEAKSNYSLNNSLTTDKVFSEYSGDDRLDAATALLGKGWRTPTKYEMKELLTKCSWEWGIKNNIAGYEVTGPNGNSIFLPAAGDYVNDIYRYDNLHGSYWTSTPCSNNHYSYYLLFEKEVGTLKMSNNARYAGFSIRGVQSISNEGNNEYTYFNATINGKQVYADDVISWSPEKEYGCYEIGTWFGYKENDRSNLILFYFDNTFTPTSGTDLTKQKGFACRLFGETDKFVNYTSGSAIVNKIYNSDYIIIDFKNCKFSNKITIDGILCIQFK